MTMPQVVAHRGDPIAHVENTLQAIAHAALAGLSVVEIDVRLSSDRTPILLHDETLERLWARPEKPGALTVSELASLAPVGHGECMDTHDFECGVPSLERALDAVGGAVLLVDFPGEPEGAGEEIARVAARLIRDIALGEGSHPDARRAAAERAEFTGGLEAVRAVRSVLPEARLRMTHPLDSLPPIELIEELRPFSWNPQYSMCTPATVAAAHELGLAATCWTVDDAETARALAGIGVDAITSNRALDIAHAFTDIAEGQDDEHRKNR